jgi:hypothetical protein
VSLLFKDNISETGPCLCPEVRSLSIWAQSTELVPITGDKGRDGLLHVFYKKGEGSVISKTSIFILIYYRHKVLDQNLNIIDEYI